METQNIISVVTVLFIVGMIWLRTRVLYTREVRGVLKLQRAGKVYFAAMAAVLVSGWVLAPLIGRLAWPGANVAPLLMRVIWFLATYYVFILVHRLLKVKGVAVYKATT